MALRTVWPPVVLLTVAIIAPHLTLGTTLGDFQANTATGFKIIPVAEQLQKCLAAKVSGGVKLLCKSSGFLLGFQEANV